MKTAIILHGMPEKENYYKPSGEAQSNCHWLPWLQQQLIIRDILAQTPEMPTPYAPVYEDWKREFERFDLNENTLLVGHSCGGGFITRYLSENKDIKVGRVVLVAPWTDEEESLDTGMFDFTVDPEFPKRTASVTVFTSTNDDQAMQETLKALKAKVPNLKYREFSNYGHFTLTGMGTREFPELLTELVD